MISEMNKSLSSKVICEVMSGPHHFPQVRSNGDDAGLVTLILMSLWQGWLDVGAEG